MRVLEASVGAVVLQTIVGCGALNERPARNELAEVGRASAAVHTARERVGLTISVESLAGGEPLASTKGEVEAQRTMTFESKDSETHATSRLTVSLEPRDDSSFVAHVQWDEQTSGGREVHWAPTLAVPRDGEGSAELTWLGGDGRRIALRLTPPQSPSATQAPAQSPKQASTPAPEQPPTAVQTPQQTQVASEPDAALATGQVLP